MKVVRFGVLAVVLACIVLAGTGAAQAVDSSGFVVVPTPWVKGVDNHLNDVAAVTSTDVWAVGTGIRDPEDGKSRFLVVHWNGMQWKDVAVPTLSSSDGLSAISLAHDKSLWAVGASFPGRRATAVVLRLAGSEWIAMAPPSGVASLSDVEALTSSNVWAVGALRDGRGAFVHWNGASWRVTATSSGFMPTTIDSVSGGDVYAAGYVTDIGAATRGVVSHWDGTAWAQVATTPGYAFGLSATSSNVWVVGRRTNPSTGTLEPLASRMTGTSWSQANPFAYVELDHWLFGVAATSSTNVWAVGGRRNAERNMTLTLIEHWNGSTWVDLHGPNSPFGGELAAVTAVPGHPNDLWAVGTGNLAHPFILHHPG